MKTWYAIIGANGAVEAVGETERDPTEGRTADEIERMRLFASLREREEEPTVAAFQRTRALDKVSHQISEARSDEAYAAKLRHAERWLIDHPPPVRTPPEAVWRRALDEARYPLLYDEVEVRGVDPWTAAQDILGAINRTAGGRLGMRARERARIERREWLKGLRGGD